MQNNVGNRGKSGRRFTREMSFMRAVVNEYHLSNLSYGELARKHGLGVAQIRQWVLKFSSDLEVETCPLPLMTPEEQKQLDALQKQNQALIKKLELANLKITGLEMMIDSAEEELHLDIRKKSGTKQSEA